MTPQEHRHHVSSQRKLERTDAQLARVGHAIRESMYSRDPASALTAVLRQMQTSIAVPRTTIHGIPVDGQEMARRYSLTYDIFGPRVPS